MVRKIRDYLPERFGGGRPVVPVVRLSGPIGIAMPGRGGLTLETLEPSLSQAFSTRHAVAVALVLNSPGGAAAQSHLIHLRVRQLAEEKKLPVVAYVEDVAASGGYMIACAADEIVVDPASIVGSIGVISASFGLDRAIDRLGIDRRVHTAGDRKATLDPFSPESAEDVAHLATLQREIHEAFIALVRKSRGDRLVGDADLFSGLFWSGRRGVDLGLADRIGTLNQDLVAKFGDKVDIRPINQEKGFFRKYLFGSNASSGLPPMVSVEEAITALRGELINARYGL